MSFSETFDNKSIHEPSTSWEIVETVVSECYQWNCIGSDVDQVGQHMNRWEIVCVRFLVHRPQPQFSDVVQTV